MAKTYKATVNFRVWKQHTCVGCERPYSYLMTREVVGEGPSETAAENAAAQQIQKTIENDVDYQACPSCGVVQPEMLADRKGGYYVAAIAVALIGLGLALILGLTEVLVISTSAWVAVGSLGAAFLLALRGALFNGNSDLQSNQAKAEGEVSQGNVRRDESSSERAVPREYEESGFGGLQIVALVLWLAMIGAAVAPVALRTTGGWTANEGWYPGVVGPGDESTIYFDQEITSINGYWHGSVNVQVANANDVGANPGNLTATTKASSWGDSISGRSVSNNDNKMWAKVKFPKEEALADKELVLELSVFATYPFEMAGGFVDKQGQFTHTARVSLSEAGAGTTYRQSWLFGQIAAIIGVIVASIMLFSGNRAMAAKGNPTEAFFPEDPDPEAGGDVDPLASGPSSSEPGSTPPDATDPPSTGFSHFDRRDEGS